jgi:hypothetical protein
MKKSSLAILAFALPALALIASCSKDSFGKAVTSIDDFLAVASDAEFKIAYCELKLASGSTKNNGSSVATSSASSAESEAAVAHGAYLYTNGDYQISNGTENYIGVSRTTGTVTQYFLVNTTSKKALLSDTASDLDQERAAAKKLIDNDYAVLKAAYTSMQGYVGKSASDFANMTTLSLTRSIAGTTAGYTLYTVLTTDTDRTETSEYITLDQFNGKWAFSNYSKRVTQYILGSDAQTKYSITEYKVNVVDALSPLAVSLSTYSIYLKGKTASDVTLPNGIPLSTK